MKNFSRKNGQALIEFVLIAALVGVVAGGAYVKTNPAVFRGYFKNSVSSYSGIDNNGQLTLDNMDREYNVYGYNSDGYDVNGWNAAGWNRNGINKVTGTKYDINGYDINGWNAQGWNAQGINKDTGTKYDVNGYDINGWNAAGWNRNGINKDTGTKYDINGYDINGWNAQDWNAQGINKVTGTKYDINGYDKDGYDKDGWNRDGINKVTGTKYDVNGYDRDGYNRDGWNRDGINKVTSTKYDINGYDRNGYDKDGYDRAGYNAEGYDRAGFNRLGYDRDGYGRDGYNAQGYNRDGYDRDGYDRLGYNAQGYNRAGYDREGYDRNGYNAQGYNRDGYDREGYDIFGYDAEGYNRDGINRDGYDRYGIHHNADGSYSITERDADGRIIRVTLYNLNRTVRYIDTYTYSYDPEGGLNYYTVTRTNAAGIKLSESTYDASDALTTYQQYYPSGLVSSTTYYSNGEVIIYKDYDSTGRKTSDIRYNSDGSVNIQTLTAYNPDGSRIETTTGSSLSGATSMIGFTPSGHYSVMASYDAAGKTQFIITYLDPDAVNRVIVQNMYGADGRVNNVIVSNGGGLTIGSAVPVYNADGSFYEVLRDLSGKAINVVWFNNSGKVTANLDKDNSGTVNAADALLLNAVGDAATGTMAQRISVGLDPW